MNVLLFGGTRDGRELAERIAALPVELTVSVATDYGLECLASLPPRVKRLAGRLDRQAMERLITDTPFAVVVDATHPYAREARQVIREAALAAGVRRFRLVRESGGGGDFVTAATAGEAAERLADMEGNILLATGSKDLPAFAHVPDGARRLHARVLPTAEALDACARAGIARRNIVAMQGPFSRELNTELLRHCDIRVLVTKDGGAAGGFGEKLAAARDAGVRVVVIGRPDDEEGMDAASILAAVRAMAEEAACG